MVVQNKKILPIGKDDFRKIRESELEYYYVDKTMMIQDFVAFGGEVTLITRPRRFGKTLNMTMLRDFFDIIQDSQAIFDGLAIMETEYAKKINSTPVISLSLKGCTGDSVAALIDAVGKEVRKEYRRYAEILTNVDKADYAYRGYFNVQTNLESERTDANELKYSLEYLLQALYTFYGVKPILLIDEYDNPIIESHQQGFREEFTSFYGSFLTMALKGNPHLGQALLTGIQRVAKESIFSKLNNIIVYNVLDERYASYFGLTTSETSELLAHYDLELTEDVKRRYDGYLFGGIEMYNPWSVLCYAERKILKNYWLKTSTNALIKESVLAADVNFYRSFEELIKSGEVEVTLNLEASFTELPHAETLWGLLVNAGYLTITNEDYEFEQFVVRIPNEEIKTEFKRIVGAYTNLSSQLLKDMLLALMRGQIEEFLKIYQQIVLESTSYHDSKENAYHMLLLGMMMNLREMYNIKSNLESGHGRSDIIMESYDAKRPHIIIEFKQGEDVEKLKHEALKQIHENKYYAELKGEVLLIGLAHDIKKCQLVHEMITR